ncbi:MAG: hypothetical protein KC776_28210 [Myxococcales bacterium]|nr:hypothetical protein [Myxococcales bacterium]MCB9581397.1 hypothetical protein [Polyangiaceae bacterium]
MKFRALLGATLLSGCGGAPPPAPATPIPSATPTSAPDVPAPSLPPQKLSRWVPGDIFRHFDNGKQAAVVAGRRILISDGEATVLDEKPLPGLGRPVRVPELLGGGVLFTSDSHVYFASAFEAAPRLITRRASSEARIGVGRSQVFVEGALYALPNGEKIAPPVKDMVMLFGTPKGVVAAVSKTGDLYVSTAHGQPFKKSPASGVQYLGYDGKGIVVSSKGGSERLDADGHLVPRPNEPGMTVSDNVDAFQEPWPDFSRPPPEPSAAERLLDPLVTAMDAETALAVKGEDLLVLDGRTGAITNTIQGAFAGHENCFPIRGGTPAFIGCNDGPAMTLMRIESTTEKPTVERSFKGTYTQDFGDPPSGAPLALPKRCDGSNVPGAACLRKSDGTWVDVPAPPDPQKLLSKVPFNVSTAAENGAVYRFGWMNGNGDLIVTDSGQKKVRRIDANRFPKWAKGGIRWDALGIHDGTLRFLIAGDSPGVLEIHPDDSVTGEQLEGRMASIHDRALLISKSGELRETLDGGETFTDVPAPPGGAPKSGFFRCVETGCSLGPWHRVGWGPD